MGCGQSKIGIYQRKSKSKKNDSKRSADDGENEEETDEGEETINAETKDYGESERGDEDSDSVTSKIKQMAQQQTGGAVLAQSDISSSQLDFFKMLDEKIENGPDYEESDEEEQLARMENLLQEWRAACLARQQKRHEQQDNWPSPARTAKPYQDDYETYPARRPNPVDTQRFPTGYSQCPPNATINIHLQNSFRMTPEQPRIQPRIPLVPNYHPFQPPTDTYNHCEDPSGHPLSTNDPPNPLRSNYTHLMLRQTAISSQMQHYDNQRLYSDSIRQYPDFPRTYPDQRPYQPPRPIPTVNVLHEHRLYAQDLNTRPYPVYQDDSRQQEDVQRMMLDQVARSYHDPQRQDSRPTFMGIDSQRAYHERLKEKQRQLAEVRQMEGPRTPGPRPPLVTQRSGQDPQRIYRDLESEDHFRQERFPESSQESATGRMHNPTHFKAARSVSVDVQYVAGPPPPREVIPLQGAPGPPQGSPRPLVARGLQTNMHRLPPGSVVHYRKPQGAFT